MTEVEFQRVLKEALEERYADIPDPDELEYEYTFSPRFERRMKRMIRNFDRIRSKAQREACLLYTSEYRTPLPEKAGNHRFAP